MPNVHEMPVEVLNDLSETTRTAVQRLRRHQPEAVDSSGYPANKLAAVLVLLYEKAGELRVLLTTRDKSLRAHPGQVALPGGKVDGTDADVYETAYREAHEEVGLPPHYPHVYTICTLRPYIASSKLLVTPVVALLTDLSVLEKLVPSPGEVDRIFDHPLEAILDPTLATKEDLAPKGSKDWIYEEEFHCTSDIDLPWLANSTYRMHRFRSGAFAIKGLTSDILIAVAEIVYEKPTVYDRYAPNQLKTFAPILRVLLGQVPVQDVVSGTSTPTPKVEVGIPSGRAQGVVKPTE
ncbi:NUDIX hydrolase domain-like protein [Ganoderma leucocontextum]|nr:NUDIX hydrolase domain-like protein [Ganoderma leucocontextum]